MTPIACIYHKDCIDGTTAAAVVLRKFPDAQCFPVGHSTAAQELKEIFPQIPLDAVLYIVDTTHGLEMALERGQSVVVIDHHVGERERVEHIAEMNAHCTYIFDNERSGASLTWTYFFPDEQLPALVAHVEDIDLWKHALGENTEHAANYLALLRNDPASIRVHLDEDIKAIYAHGAILTRLARQEVALLIEIAPVPVAIGTHVVAAFNITNHTLNVQSACGHELAKLHGAAVALYTIRGDIVRFSFRSLDDQSPSALELARVLNGGGHRNSAGATMRTQDFISNLKLYDHAT